MIKRMSMLFGMLIFAALFVAPASAQEGQSITVNLNEQNGSGMSGTATLTEQGGQTMVTLNLTGDVGDVEHPAHIHMGSCANLDPAPAFPLNNVVGGMSETMVDVAIADLLAAPHAINLHKSAEEISVYVACGNIAGGTGGGQVVPNTGSGTSNTTMLLTIVAAVGVAFVGSGLVLHRRFTA